jgi:hypothetical protein
MHWLNSWEADESQRSLSRGYDGSGIRGSAFEVTEVGVVEIFGLLLVGENKVEKTKEK